MGGGEGAVAVGHAQGASGVGAGGAHGVVQGNVHLGDGGAQASHLVACGSRQGAVGQGAAAAVEREVLAAKLVFAIFQAAATQAVGDDDHAVGAEEFEGHANHGGMNMHAVGDDLGRDALGLSTGGNGAGLAVMEGRHCVEEVRHVARAGLKSVLGRVIVGAHVGEGDAHFVVHLTNEVEVARLLGGHVHKLDTAMSRLLQLGELLDARRAHVLGVLGTHFVGRDVGALHVHTDKLGFANLGLKDTDVAHDGHQTVVWQGHRSGADGCDAALCLVGCHAMQALSACIGQVIAHAAMKVQVDEAGDDITIACVKLDTFAGAIFFGNRRAADPNVAGDKTICAENISTRNATYLFKRTIHRTHTSYTAFPGKDVA